MKVIAALAISTGILAAQSTRPVTRSVTAVRHWSLSDVTRVAIEVSGEFEFKTDRLHNPERIYFDILNARPRIESRRVWTETLDDKRLQKIRVAETTPGVTRVVLDLTGDMQATTSQLTIPDRLIIELRPSTIAPAIPTTLPAPASLPVPAPSAPRLEAPATKPALKPIVAEAEKEAAPAPVTPGPKTSKAEPTQRVETASSKGSKSELAHVETAAAKSSKAEPAFVETAVKTSKTEPVRVETATAARRTSTGTTSLVRTLGLKIGRVVIDPGHGGHDQGTEGARGLLEKDLVLDVAMRVGKLIEDRMGAEVVYTRSDDTFIPLEMRTEIANEKKADLFISIHANSSPVSRISGVETYYRNMTTSRDALDVAARENAASQRSIADLEDLLHKVMIGDKVEESKEFAARVQTSLYAFSARTFPDNKNRGVKKAPFVVLAGAKSPSVLVEIGFLSNSKEEALLRKADYKQKLAEALYRGIARYAESLSHVAVAKAGSE
jgi:N-acetylmuramoyl-L-alanine amidase